MDFNTTAVAQNLTLKEANALTLQELSTLLPLIEQLTTWAKAVSAYALELAQRGEVIPGYKLVAGRDGNRTFTNTEQVVQTLLANGVAEDSIYEKKLLTLTRLEALLGKKRFNELLGDFITRPAGAATLVKNEDPRPALVKDLSAIFPELSDATDN